MLINNRTLDILIKKKKYLNIKFNMIDDLTNLLFLFRPIIAPLLNSFSSRYSTFWTSDENKYDQIYNRELVGCFKVTGLRDCYLVDLTNKKTCENPSN